MDRRSLYNSTRLDGLEIGEVAPVCQFVFPFLFVLITEYVGNTLELRAVARNCPQCTYCDNLERSTVQMRVIACFKS